MGVTRLRTVGKRKWAFFNNGIGFVFVLDMIRCVCCLSMSALSIPTAAHKNKRPSVRSEHKNKRPRVKRSINSSSGSGRPEAVMHCCLVFPVR